MTKNGPESGRLFGNFRLTRRGVGLTAVGGTGAVLLTNRSVSPSQHCEAPNPAKTVQDVIQEINTQDPTFTDWLRSQHPSTQIALLDYSSPVKMVSTSITVSNSPDLNEVETVTYAQDLPLHEWNKELEVSSNGTTRRIALLNKGPRLDARLYGHIGTWVHKGNRIEYHPKTDTLQSCNPKSYHFSSDTLV